MGMQILQMFTRITEVKEQQGFSWETLSQIVVVVPAIILFFMTIYRYKLIIRAKSYPFFSL